MRKLYLWSGFIKQNICGIFETNTCIETVPYYNAVGVVIRN